MNQGLKIAFAASLLSCLIPTSSRADMPNYNVEAQCREVAASGGTFSETIMQGCLQMEQSAYNQLKPNWDSLSSTLRGQCDEVARSGSEGSYTILQGCLKMEQSAAKSNQRFSFQR